jgi:hypothetical protein
LFSFFVWFSVNIKNDHSSASSLLDYLTPVLLQYEKDDGSSDDEGMLCKLDLGCIIFTILCVYFTCIDRILQQCSMQCVLNFHNLYMHYHLWTSKPLSACNEKNALWLSVHKENSSFFIPKLRRQFFLKKIIPLLCSPYHFKCQIMHCTNEKIAFVCATLPLISFLLLLVMPYLTVWGIACRSSWSWEGKGKLMTIKDQCC